MTGLQTDDMLGVIIIVCVLGYIAISIASAFALGRILGRVLDLRDRNERVDK